jgi:Ni,Fe-hydrogenase III small subunit/ferredoxin-like protein FixX
MSNWALRGLRTGIKSTRYPRAPERAAGTTPGLPASTPLESAADAQSLADACPTQALQPVEQEVRFDDGRCVHCRRCERRAGARADWRDDYEWAHRPAPDGPVAALPAAFGGSLHVFVVDAGDCGACLSELAQLSGPYYNVQRLGFFITPSPRHADVMIVVGPLTVNMQDGVRRCYEAMPEPRRVIAVGACAISGGVFAGSFAVCDGAAGAVPVDLVVPGCPPPPLALLHALLVVTGRAAGGAPR